MLVRSKDMVFREGRRFRVDPFTGLTEAFEITLKEGEKLPSHLVPAETKTAKIPNPVMKLNRKQLIIDLTKAGIEFEETATDAELQALLINEQKAHGSNPLKEADALNGPTKQELMAALKAKGIKFHVTMSSAELSALLTGEKEPEGGTGNAEVI